MTRTTATASAVHGELTFLPVIGPALWQIIPDSAIRKGLGMAFAPGYDVPDAFVDDFKRMTYTSYDDAARARTTTSSDEPLDRRLRETGVPLMAIFGAEDQIFESKKSLAAFGEVPGAQTALIPGAGPLAQRREAGSNRGIGALRVDPRASRTMCKMACRIGDASERAPKLRTHVRFKDNTDRTADRRRRPADRLRHARRVRPGARGRAHRMPVPSPPAPLASRDTLAGDRSRSWRRRPRLSARKAGGATSPSSRRSWPVSWPPGPLVSWHFASVLLVPDTAAGEPVDVEAVLRGRIVLQRNDETERPGVYGLVWRGGHAIVGDVLSESGMSSNAGCATSTATSFPASTHGSTPTSTRARRASALGVPYATVPVAGEPGPMPAWVIPPEKRRSSRAGDWAIVVHGINGDPQEGLRLVPTLRRLGPDPS